MYTRIVTIPRITAETAETLNASVPGLLKLGHVPLIETEEAAAEQARLFSIKHLDGPCEYVSRINSVILNAAGTAWTVNVTIAGD